MNSCQTVPNLRPSEECVICGRAFSETRGHRIISQKIRGVGISDRHVGGGNKNAPYVSRPLNDSETLFMVFWGEVDFWTDDAMSKAIEMYHDGQHPYICSYCGKRTCSVCGYSLISPVGSDYMHDNGSISHAPIFPAKVPCMNETCANAYIGNFTKDK